MSTAGNEPQYSGADGTIGRANARLIRQHDGIFPSISSHISSTSKPHLIPLGVGYATAIHVPIHHVGEAITLQNAARGTEINYRLLHSQGGMGSSSMEVSDVTGYLLASYRSQMGRPVDPSSGVIGSVAAEAELVPTEFVAVTVQV